MSLNIKNPRVHALARQLSEQTGRSQTSVIEEALTRMLAELERPTQDANRRRSIDAVLADIDCRVPTPTGRGCTGWSCSTIVASRRDR